MADANKFWKNGPKLRPKMSQWKPGEARSYIPIISMGRPETVPAEGIVGKVVNIDGDRQVRFTVRGAKHAGTGGLK